MSNGDYLSGVRERRGFDDIRVETFDIELRRFAP